MATRAEMLAMLNTGDVGIRSAIVSKGVAVLDTTLYTDLENKIRSIPQSGGAPAFGASWGRNPERPDLPFDADTGPDAGSIYMLYGASETSMNDMAFQFTGGTTDKGTVYWGDGTSETISNTKLEHVYNYSDITTTPDSDGIKWIWIQFALDATMTSILIVQSSIPSSRPQSSVYYIPQVYEMYINLPIPLITWTWSTASYTRFGMLEYFRWYGKCNLSSLSTFFAYCLRLRDCIFDDSSSVTNFSNMLYYSTISGKFQADTSSASTISGFMRFSTVFNSPLTLSTGNSTNIANAFQNINAMAHGIELDVSGLTADIGTTTFSNAYALPSLRLHNMPTAVYTISVANTAMSATSLANLFSDLCDRSLSTAGTITITNAAGAAALTTAQRAIAQNKNWGIVG